ncbi:hypothetical protein Tco_0227519 [Tanacetum coccineum]
MWCIMNPDVMTALLGHFQSMLWPRYWHNCDGRLVLWLGAKMKRKVMWSSDDVVKIIGCSVDELDTIESQCLVSSIRMSRLWTFSWKCYSKLKSERKSRTGSTYVDALRPPRTNVKARASQQIMGIDNP